MGKKMNSYRVLLGNPGKKDQLGRPKCRWEDNNKADLRGDVLD
jgi:hypothetical protein